jgi:hypothetical protein
MSAVVSVPGSPINSGNATRLIHLLPWHKSEAKCAELLKGPVEVDIQRVPLKLNLPLHAG